MKDFIDQIISFQIYFLKTCFLINHQVLQDRRACRGVREEVWEHLQHLRGVRRQQWEGGQEKGDKDTTITDSSKEKEVRHISPQTSARKNI